MHGKIDQPVGALWDTQNRMAVFVEGDPWTSAGQPAEAYAYDASGYRWLQWDRTGTARLSFRDSAGQTNGTFVVDPTSTRLETEYVHGAGQLLVERLPASTPPGTGGIGGNPGSSIQKIQVTLNQTPFIRDLLYYISADERR